MALTNYLMQTFICTTIYYGHGFGLFGSVERTGQILIVFAVWAVELLGSPLWLDRFRFEPFKFVIHRPILFSNGMRRCGRSGSTLINPTVT
jgi:uncharacterized protein